MCPRPFCLSDGGTGGDIEVRLNGWHCDADDDDLAEDGGGDDDKVDDKAIDDCESEGCLLLKWSLSSWEGALFLKQATCVLRK